VSARVVIVGMGPVGATAALLLAGLGVETLVIERRRRLEPLTRAVTVDDEALRVLQAVGLGGDLPAPQMLEEEPIRFRSRTGALLLELPTRVSANGHPTVAFLHQWELEAALREGLSRRSDRVRVELGCEAVGLRHDARGVALRVRPAGGGEAREIGADYLLACDGARSTLRVALGIPLCGFTSRRRWLAIDAAGGGRRSGEGGFEFLCDPRRPAANGPLPGGRHRFEFMLRPGESDDERAVERLLAPWGAVEVIRSEAYPQHARVATRWRAGRVMLLGDAAHLSPTFAGQGLSTGLRDAGNLSWKLAAVLSGQAAPALLRTYEAERHPHALRMVAVAVALGRVVETSSAPVAWMRDAAVATLLGSQSVSEWAARGGWKPAPVYRLGFAAPPRRGAAGTLLRQSPVSTPGGRPLRLDDALGRGFALIGYGVDPATGLDAGARFLLRELGARLVCVNGAPTASAEPDTVHLRSSNDRVPTGQIALVRPDRHVFDTFPPAESGDAVRELAAALRSPR